MKAGKITQRLDGVLNELEAEFKNLEVPLLSRQDFLRLIEELRDIGSSSRAPSLLAELFRMFDAFGLSYEKGKPVEYYAKLVEAAELPEAGDLEARIFRALYEKFDKYPLPQEYMLRVVDKFSSVANVWRGDTLRLRILKQFIKYGDYLRGAVSAVTLKLKITSSPKFPAKLLRRLFVSTWTMVFSTGWKLRTRNRKSLTVNLGSLSSPTTWRLGNSEPEALQSADCTCSPWSSI